VDWNRRNFQIRDTEPDDTAMARRIAGRLVDSRTRARTYLPYVTVSACPKDGKWRVVPPADIEWLPIKWPGKTRNEFGVSIPKKEPRARERAVDWVVVALLKGYTVFVGIRGRSLEMGDCDEDIWAFQARQKAVA
jgi:hypothetical protein